MRVFVTGATGLVGSAVVQELLGAGHEVLGLARSDASEKALVATGVAVQRGSLTDLDSLRDGAAQADAVIHTAFVHDFSDFAAAVETDRRAVETLCAALAGWDRPLLVTSGTPGAEAGNVATEQTAPPPESPAAGRFLTEELAMSFVDHGVRVAVIRLPRSVHGAADRHGFVPQMIDIARRKGFSAYVDGGENRWCAVHQLDAAQLYRLVLEQAPAGARAHAVGDGTIPARELAEVIGRHLDLPVKSIPAAEAIDHFGFLGAILSMDHAVSSAATRDRFGWQPAQPGLLAGLEEGHYFA
jgi:nucleoside-diphosphate-sugar epimerase